VPVLHYIAPQYWAWAPWRLRRYRRAVDATLTILPFEPRFYDRLRLPAAYVGHPLLDHLAAHPAAPSDVAAVRAQPTVALLPGSRRAEIELHLPAMVELARHLRADHAELRFALPHVDPARAALISDLLARLGGSDLIEFHPGPLAAWLSGARLVVAKSGTGSLEACLHGTPTVVAYRMRGPIWGWLRRHFLTTPWVAGAKLIAGRVVVPEHVFFDELGWDAVERSVRELLDDGAAREHCLLGLAEVRTRLGAPGASARVAHWIAPFIAPRRIA
jgi:lipid-A-disaccharide synthase